MSPRARSMQNLPTAGRWSIYIALAVVFAIACAFLANWQFTRNEERSGQLALVEANYDAEPVPLSTLVAGVDDLDPGDQWRPVILTGRYLPDEQLLVRNRPHGGTAAFEVLTPLLLEDGRTIIVNRGWVPPREDGAVPSAAPAPPDGELTVLARLRTGEQLPASGRSAPEGQVPTIHLPTIAGLVGGETITGAYALMVNEDPSAAETPHPLEAPSEDPGPHLSYAIQWILFAIMGFVFIVYVIRTEVRHRREDRTDEPQTPRRRRDRDADDEDALLDSLTPAGR